MVRSADADAVLVIGGTGPTGPYVVEGLRARGERVAICHTGRHEIDEIPADVEHVHTDPFDVEPLAVEVSLHDLGQVRVVLDDEDPTLGRRVPVRVDVEQLHSDRAYGRRFPPVPRPWRVSRSVTRPRHSAAPRALPSDPWKPRISPARFRAADVLSLKADSAVDGRRPRWPSWPRHPSPDG